MSDSNYKNELIQDIGYELHLINKTTRDLEEDILKLLKELESKEYKI